MKLYRYFLYGAILVIFYILIHIYFPPYWPSKVKEAIDTFFTAPLEYWWFVFPFVVNFFVLKYEYIEDEWTWKNVILPGIGMFFFLFMIGGVFTHTILFFIPDFSSILEIFM